MLEQTMEIRERLIDDTIECAHMLESTLQVLLEECQIHGLNDMTDIGKPENKKLEFLSCKG